MNAHAFSEEHQASGAVQARPSSLNAISPLAPLVTTGISVMREAIAFAERRQQARIDYIKRMTDCNSAAETSELQLDFANKMFLDYLEEPLVLYGALERQLLTTLPEQWHQVGNLISAELSQFEYCPEADEARCRAN